MNDEDEERSERLNYNEDGGSEELPKEITIRVEIETDNESASSYHHNEEEEDDDAVISALKQAAATQSHSATNSSVNQEDDNVSEQQAAQNDLSQDDIHGDEGRMVLNRQQILLEAMSRNPGGARAIRDDCNSSNSSSQEDAAKETPTHPEVLRRSLPGAVYVYPAPRMEEPDSVASIRSRSSGPDMLDVDVEGQPDLRVTAVRVDVERAELEAQIRQDLLETTVQADAVVSLPVEEVEESRAIKNIGSFCQGKRITGKALPLLLIMMSLAGIVLGVSLGLAMRKDHNDKDAKSEENKDSSIHVSFHNQSTLERVLQRGVVRCGVQQDFFGWSNPNPKTGQNEGLSVDLCRAVSTVVFGNPIRYELAFPTKSERYRMLANGTIDVVANIVAWRMSPDVFLPEIQAGVTFSTPYFYTGMKFLGQPSFVKCADQQDTHSPSCRALRICVHIGTIIEDLVQRLLPGGSVVPCTSGLDVTDKFSNGHCNVVASVPEVALAPRFQQAGYQGDFTVGDNFFSREDLSLATLDNDTEWSRIIETVVQTFLFAEAHNTTRTNAKDIRALFNHNRSQRLASTMESLVSIFGNYGELYAKHFQSLEPRQGRNMLYNNHHVHHNNNASSPGLLYSLAFFQLEDPGPEPATNSTLDKIQKREYLNCGFFSKGMSKALDIEFCQSITASIFAGDTSLVQLVDLSPAANSSAHEEETYHNSMDALDKGRVDVVAGVPITLQVLLGDWQPFDNSYYTFSKPYFYDTTIQTTPRAFAMMSRADDDQWNSFVLYVTMASIHAEEQGITQSKRVQMPVTNLFGQRLKQCFRDVIFAVGNYGEMYNRTLQSVLPRSGANLLNQRGGAEFGPQHFALPLY